MRLLMCSMPCYAIRKAGLIKIALLTLNVELGTVAN